MMKTTKKLVTSSHDMTLGKHRVEYNEEQGQTIANFWYFSTIICSVNLNDRTFETAKGNWDTMSTNRAINDYRSYYQNNGYAEKFHSLDSILKYIATLPWNSYVSVIYDSNTAHKFRIGKVKKDDNYSIDFNYYHGTKSYDDTIGLLRPSRLTKELSKTFEKVLN